MIKILLLLALGGIATAGPQDDTKTEQQHRGEFSKSMASLRKDPKQFAEFTQLIQQTLGWLGYGTTFTGRMDERTTQALREYQRHNSIDVTGTVTYDTLQRLLADGKAVKSDPVPLPPSEASFEEWEKGVVSASGTWVNDGDSGPTMPQVSHITCYRESSVCIESLGILFEGLLKADTDVLAIERWDDVEIVTKPLQANCTRTVTRFNRTQGLVTSLRSTISNDSACSAVEKNDLHSVLKSGADIYLNQLRTNNAVKEKAIRVGASAVGVPK